MKKQFYTAILALLVMGFYFDRIDAQTFTNNTSSYSQSSEDNKNTAVNYKYMRKNQGRIDQCLKLSDEQEEQSKQIRAESMKKVKPLYDELYLQNRKLNKLKLNNAGFAEIDAQKQIVNDLHKKINEIQDKNMSQYTELLTPEQKQKFDEFQKKRMMQMKSRD